MNMFAYIGSFVSAFADAFVVAYEAPEAAAFRARNRECLVEMAMVAAAIGYEAIDSLINFLVARAAKDTSIVVEAGRTSYYTRSTFATLEQGYSLWLEIGEANFKVAETTLVYGAVTAAFVITLVRCWAEEQVESCIAKETAASEEQLVIGGHRPTFSNVSKAKSLVKSFGSMTKAKAILGSSSRSWASLAADLILFATEGGYSTLEEAVAELKASI